MSEEITDGVEDSGVRFDVIIHTRRSTSIPVASSVLARASTQTQVGRKDTK